MNFNEIKKAMDKEQNSELEIPISTKDLAHSVTIITKILKQAKIETIFTLLLIIYLFTIPQFIKLHELAESIYYICVFNLSIPIFGLIIYNFSSIRHLGQVDLDTRNTIQNFIIEMKTNIKISKTVVHGIFIMLCIPLLILLYGREIYPLTFVEKYLLLRVSWIEVLIFLAGLTVLIVINHYIILYSIKRTYENKIYKLEKIINQF